MEITALRQEHVQVTISNSEICDIVRHSHLGAPLYLRKAKREYIEQCLEDSRHKSIAYIKDGFWMYEEEAYTSHSYSIDHKIREATEEEIETYNTFRELEQHLFNLTLKK